MKPTRLNKSELGIFKSTVFWLTLALSCLSARGADAAQIVVTTTIQAAVDQANPGDTVFIGPGIYDEQVVVRTSNLTILGSGIDSTIIRPTQVSVNSTGTDIPFPVSAILLIDGANGVRVKNFTVDGHLADDGAALYTLLVETLLGLQVQGNRLTLAPCLPEEWPGYRAQIRHGDSVYAISVARGAAWELHVDGARLVTANGDQQYAISPSGVVHFEAKAASEEARIQQQHYDRVASAYLHNLSYPHTQEYSNYLDDKMLKEFKDRFKDLHGPMAVDRSKR